MNDPDLPDIKVPHTRADCEVGRKWVVSVRSDLNPGCRVVYFVTLPDGS